MPENTNLLENKDKDQVTKVRIYKQIHLRTNSLHEYEAISNDKRISTNQELFAKKSLQ